MIMLNIFVYVQASGPCSVTTTTILKVVWVRCIMSGGAHENQDIRYCHMRRQREHTTSRPRRGCGTTVLLAGIQSKMSLSEYRGGRQYLGSRIGFLKPFLSVAKYFEAEQWACSEHGVGGQSARTSFVKSIADVYIFCETHTQFCVSVSR